FDLHAEGAGRQAGADADAVGGEVDVLGHLGGPEVRPLLVNGHVHLAEFQLPDDPQSAVQGVLAEALRRTSDEHGSLRCVVPVGGPSWLLPGRLYPWYATPHKPRTGPTGMALDAVFLVGQASPLLPCLALPEGLLQLAGNRDGQLLGFGFVDPYAHG